jgi:Calcineurin-like phosphoesterase/Cupredoxin-like domain
MSQRNRREFLTLAGMGGVVMASQLAGCFSARRGRGDDDARASGGTMAGGARVAGGALAVDDFFFLQLSDTHVGFKGPPNPEADHTLSRAVARISGSGEQPDFIVFTGDLTHTTDDDAERRRRMAMFKERIAPLSGQTLRFLPGEHDASLDEGAAYRESFGASRWSFAHKGIHFVGVDNVSDPRGAIGDDGLAWLRADLEGLDPDAPIVVLTHRPLFDLYPSWDWATKDGAQATDILSKYRHVTVFYGHIHQEHHDDLAGISHHAARSLIFPLPAPGSVPEKKPVKWDAARPFHDLGWRRVASHRKGLDLERTELALDEAPVAADAARPGARTIAITAKRWQFDPRIVRAKAGVPILFELTSLDHKHGFAIPELGVDVMVTPGAVTRVPLTPPRAGSFAFHCSVFCGSGHEGMVGTLEVS